MNRIIKLVTGIVLKKLHLLIESDVNYNMATMILSGDIIHVCVDLQILILTILIIIAEKGL